MNYVRMPHMPPREEALLPGPAILWVFRDYDDNWSVRREGAPGAKAYDSRADALEAARLYGRAWGAYRLYFQLKDGRVAQELFNLAADAPDEPVS